MTKFIINNKEQYAYRLEQNHLEKFTMTALGYRNGGIAPTLPQIDIGVTTLMLGEVTYTKIRKNIYIPPVQAELDIRGLNHQEAKKISESIKLLKENGMSTVNKENSTHTFVPQSLLNDAWL